MSAVIVGVIWTKGGYTRLHCYAEGESYLFLHSGSKKLHKEIYLL